MVEEKKPQTKFISVLFLQLIIVIYTFSGIAAKLASKHAFLSFGFFFYYGIEIVILGIYAILWQQAIKRFDLSVAYSNRGVAIFWSMIWAACIFRETITIQNIIGVVIIFIGAFIVNTGNSSGNNEVAIHD